MGDNTDWKLKVEERLTRLEEQQKRLSEVATELAIMVKNHTHKHSEGPLFEYG